LPAIRLQVRLLVERERYEQARKKMELLPAAARGALLGRLEADILLHANEPEAALAAAEKLAAGREKQGAKQGATQIWLANLARQVGENEKAEQALLKAIEINPDNPQYWEQLVGLYVEMKQFEKVTQVLREAQLRLDDEYLPLLTAKYNELQGRWREAEDIYLAAYANQMDEGDIARRMARFYLTWSKADAANRGKAARLINRILRAVHEGKLPETDSNAIWARHQAARMLAATGDYQKTQKALQLFSEKGEESQATIGEQLLKAEILATRKDPDSLLQAIAQFKNIKASQGLSLKNSLELIGLQSRVGEWNAAKSQMVDVIRQYGNEPVTWSTYVSLLIEHGELDRAKQRLGRLENMVGRQEPSVIVLRARLAAARGDKAGLHRELLTMVPSNLRLADEQQLEDIRKVAQYAADLGDHQLAKQLLGVYVRRHPEHGMLLLQQMAIHGDSGKAIDIMKQLFDKQPDAVIQLGLRMLQQRRAEAGDQAFEAVSRLVAAAVREDPESVRRKLIEAQLLELQDKYEESIQAYQEVLSYRDAPRLVRAMAMNNVSFLWALSGERLEEAAGLIDQAEEILGPISDLLDTRGVIEIARQRYDVAIGHLQRALQVEPNASKYFHLAQAYLLAGNDREAMEAWNRALEMGISSEKLSRLEQERYQDLAKKIESLR
jgi:tetratricopeptide (TPR) repeat protein